MIGYISGTIINSSLARKDITVLTTSGVGYRIYINNPEEYILGDSVNLFITTIVREDTLDLYGFPTSDDRELCELLMSVSGIGPKTAINILASTTPEMITDAIKAKNPAYLATLPGIGKKGAEKIILELSDKVSKLSFSSHIQSQTQSIQSDLLEALLSMGYQPRVISELLSQYTFESESLQGRIREALGKLQNK